MRRISILLAALAMLMFGITTSAQAAITTTINPAAAPTGTHLQTGTIGCSVDATTQLVSCTGYELAGVGNANATGSLVTSLHGHGPVPQPRRPDRRGQVPGDDRPDHHREPLAQERQAHGPTAELVARPDRGRLRGPGHPPQRQLDQELLGGTITLSSFTYTLHFAGFHGQLHHHYRTVILVRQ